LDVEPLLQPIKENHPSRKWRNGKSQTGDASDLLGLLSATWQHSPVGLAVVSGPERIFRVVSASYCAALPYPDQEVTGRPVREVWPVEQGYNEDALICQALESDTPSQFELVEHRFPDGQTHSFSLLLIHIQWQGEAGILILASETTQADDARQLAMEIAAEANRQAEEMEAIIAAMAEPVIVFDHQGRARRANPATIQLYGIDPAGLSCHELVDLLGMRHPDGSPVRAEDLPVEQALQGRVTSGQRLLLVDNDGVERVVHVSASPLSSDGGTNSVVTVWHDMTDRENLLEQLEVEQSRLETIIENAPEAILVADEEGRLIFVNPAARRILGRDIPYGRDYQWLSNLNFCHIDGTPYDPRNLPLTCSALDGEWIFNIEMLVTRPGEPRRHVMVSSAPIVDRKGNLNGAVGVFQDITEQKQAEQELRQQAARSQLLAVLSRAFAEAGLNYDELLDTIVHQVGRVFGDFCSLHLTREDGQYHYPAAFFANNTAPLQGFLARRSEFETLSVQGIILDVLQNGQPILLENVSTDSLIQAYMPGKSLPDDVLLPPTLNAILIPLRASGRRIGILSIFRVSPGKAFTAEEQAFLQDLADRAALAIEDAHLYEKEAQRARDLQALNRATTTLLSTLDLDTMLRQVVESAMLILPNAEMAALYLSLEKTHRPELRALYGAENTERLFENLEQQIILAPQEKQPVKLDRIKVPGANELEFSAIIAPLIAPKDITGALVLVASQPERFRSSDLQLLDSYATTAAVAIQNASLYEEVQRLATTDTLTGQYNRRKFFELGELEMHRFQRFNTPLSAIMFDLDNFKEINDAYGHAAGDIVLRAVAQRGRNSIRLIDILGRYGGDEFAILLPNADICEAQEIARRICQAMTAQAISTLDGEIPVAVSLGVAQANQGTDSLSSLLARADSALYAAKENGRNRIELG
jgi:diguanylate cyclase (GGDEF)-like protein/PAS domain S-box-containing protein